MSDVPASPRVTQCKYKRIGCPWHGPFHELTVHEAACAHPTKTGSELMEILDGMDQSHRKEMQLYNSIFSLLSFEKIGYTGEAPRRLLHATQVWAWGAGSQEPGGSRLWALGTDGTRRLGSGRAPGGQEDTSGKKRGRRLSRRRGRGRPQVHTCVALTAAPPTCPPHPGFTTPARWHLTVGLQSLKTVRV